MDDTARLRWRARRGAKELDVVLSAYIDKIYPGAGALERAAFERLLSLEDPALMAMLLGREAAPDAEMAGVLEQLRGAVSA